MLAVAGPSAFCLRPTAGTEDQYAADLFRFGSHFGIAAFSGQTIGNAAGALLYNYSTYPRVYCVDMPSSRPSPQLPKQGLSTSKEITAFPNPAKDEVLFTYRVINCG